MEDFTDEFRELIQDKDEFKNIVKFFIDKACEEQFNDINDPKFHEYFKAGLMTVIKENIENIFKSSGSPIETMFLNALILWFIKADAFGLIVHPVYEDTENEIEEFLKHYSNFKEFLAWYDEKFGMSSEINEYLDGEVEKGKMDVQERAYIARLILRYHMLPLGDSFHMTLQPKFPNIKVDSKSIRPDILFWIPEQPDLKVIVECDGFDYHSDKKKFTSDRKRDRLLQSKGYQILRYSGSEIYKNPRDVSVELAEYLWNLQRECHMKKKKNER